MSVRLKMDPTQKILLKRYLNKDGQAQKKFTKEVAKEANNYVPFDTGRLKDMNVEIKTDKIIYNTRYAAKQYYTNSGGNKGPLRGKLWDKRMFADKGDKIIKSIAEFVGGHIK